MRRSNHTLLGRVHGQAALEEQHDIEALYQLMDPIIRARREERDDEPARTLSELRGCVAPVTTAEVEEVEVVEARKVCAQHGGRPAALVRSLVRYNRGPSPQEFHTIWVRDCGVWYTTSVARSCGSFR